MKKLNLFLLLLFIVVSGCKKENKALIQYYAYCKNCDVTYLIGNTTYTSTDEVFKFEFIVDEGIPLMIEAVSNSGSWVEVDIVKDGKNYAYAKGFGRAKAERRF